MTGREKSSLRSCLAMALAMTFLTASLCQARDKQLLDEALNNSASDRTDTEHQYKKSLKAELNPKTTAADRKISLELGDGMGATKGRSDVLQLKPHDEAFHEKAVAQKLDKEWREVKGSVKQSSRDLKIDAHKKTAGTADNLDFN